MAGLTPERFKLAWRLLEDGHGLTFWAQLDDTGEPVLALNMNDVFYWASADEEEVPWDKLDEVAALYGMEHGSDRLIAWAAKRRGQEPQEPVMKDLREKHGIKHTSELLP